MIRAVIDTNCLRASIPPQSPFYQLYLSFKTGQFEWYVSTEILLEYEEVISKTYSSNTVQLVLHQLAIAPNVVFAEPAYKWQLIENDHDDDKFSDLAISVNADYLVSEDKDFGIFDSLSFPTLNVVGLETFLSILGTQDTY
jgi:uncharacterized protein